MILNNIQVIILVINNIVYKQSHSIIINITIAINVLLLWLDFFVESVSFLYCSMYTTITLITISTSLLPLISLLFMIIYRIKAVCVCVCI